MAPAGQEASLRRRIGKYVVTGRIGRGGMGMVYRAYDETLEREVAVKTLNAEGTLDEESRRRFQIEARAAAKLQHPNIVTVFELGEDRGIPYIAMELLPGADLEALMRSGEDMLLREKLDVMVQVCRGLHYAHERGIVHRDIKPSNIRLLEDGTAKIMDFGIAKLGGTGVTKTGMMVGTVHYMSPEQIYGKVLDGRSDLFSAGVILYELLTGRRPFPGDAPTAVLYKIVSEPALPIDTDCGECTPALQALLDRALAKAPEQRPAHAGQLAQELAAILATLTSTVAADALASVAASQRLLREGRFEESIRRLHEVKEAHPDSLEARRALRVATREMQRHTQPPQPEPDDFPELAATLQASPTRRTPDQDVPTSYIPREPAVREPPAPDASVLPPLEHSGAVPMPPISGHGVLWAAAGAVVVVLLVGAFLLGGSGGGQGALRIPVRSRPTGAMVLLDGRDTGVRTDGQVDVPRSAREVTLAFRKEGHQEASRLVRLPLAEGGAVSVSLTPIPIASVEPSPAPGKDDPKAPGDPSLILGPVGRVTVNAAYPVEVTWRGRSLGRGTATQVSLPVGRHTLTLAAPAQFLRQTVNVDVHEGAASTIEAPALGKIHIRANPDNCEVYIDGVFVEYPPILDRPIVVGLHKVSFRWPDGKRTDETVEASREAPVYVMGRKE
jgi:serine/threonine protein kinase